MDRGLPWCGSLYREACFVKIILPQSGSCRGERRSPIVCRGDPPSWFREGDGEGTFPPEAPSPRQICGGSGDTHITPFPPCSSLKGENGHERCMLFICGLWRESGCTVHIEVQKRNIHGIECPVFYRRWLLIDNGHTAGGSIGIDGNGTVHLAIVQRVQCPFWTRSERFR